MSFRKESLACIDNWQKFYEAQADSHLIQGWYSGCAFPRLGNDPSSILGLCIYASCEKKLDTQWRLLLAA